MTIQIDLLFLLYCYLATGLGFASVIFVLESVDFYLNVADPVERKNFVRLSIRYIPKMLLVVITFPVLVPVYIWETYIK